MPWTYSEGKGHKQSLRQSLREQHTGFSKHSQTPYPLLRAVKASSKPRKLSLENQKARPWSELPIIRTARQALCGRAPGGQTTDFSAKRTMFTPNYLQSATWSNLVRVLAWVVTPWSSERRRDSPSSICFPLERACGDACGRVRRRALLPSSSPSPPSLRVSTVTGSLATTLFSP